MCFISKSKMRSAYKNSKNPCGSNTWYLVTWYLVTWSLCTFLLHAANRTAAKAKIKIFLILQTCHQNLFDVFLSQRRVSILKSLIHRDMMCHFVEAAFVDTHFAQVHRNAD